MAVYSTADRAAPHVRAADHAVAIGPPPPAESYLRIDRLRRGRRWTAVRTRCTRATGSSPSAPTFAEAVERAGLVFVGPPAAAIRAMGDKTEARRRMQRRPACRSCPARSEPVTELGAALGARDGARLPGAGEGGGGRRRQGHARGARAGRAGAARWRPRPRRRARPSATRASTSRSSSSGRATWRSRCWPTGSAPCTWASASARSSAGTRSWWRRRRRRRSTPELREWMGAAAVAAAQAVGYLRRGHLRVPAGAGPVVLLPRDEHPDPGRAPGHRAGLRRGPGAGAAPHRRGRAHAGARSLAGSRAAGRSSAGSPARIRRTASCRPPAGSSTCACLAGPGVRWDGGVETRRRGHAVLRLAARQADRVGAATGREAIDRMARALDELVIDGVATNQGFHRRLHGRCRSSARATSTSSSSTVAPICWQPSLTRASRPCALADRGRAGGGRGPRAAAPGGLRRTECPPRRTGSSQARLEGLR